MPPLEHRLQQRFPQWFRGRRAHLARPLLRTIGRWSKLDRIQAFLAAHSGLRDFAFVRAALDHLQADYEVDPADLERIPARGRLLIVANHPSGALDALALLDLVRRVRTDVRIAANDLLSALEPLAGLLLPLRILGGRPSPGSLRAVQAALAAEQCVIVFPAGEVARLGWRGIRDGRWRRGFLRFAHATGAPVLPVRIDARNSALFYGASALFKPAGTALLAREMFARRQRPIRVRLGSVLHLPQGEDTEALLRRVREALYALDPAAVERPREAQPRSEAVLPAPQDPGRVRGDVEKLELLGRTLDGKHIRCGRLVPGSALMEELGRLRELTFRAVGEGTGQRLDVDLYDSWYEHIVLWDEVRSAVAGAYRVARGAQVLAERGLSGFYTASLFDYAEEAVMRIASGMELGRSFVVPEYWGGRSIDYLWQGIGAYLARHPNLRYLFGAVSISAALPPEAREQIVAYYARYYGATAAQARSRRPFLYRAVPPHFGALDAATAFAVLRANLDALGASVPMLYKQYTDLCEPGGARFLAFGVDPAFSDAVDGLIEIDLAQLRPRKRERYLVSPRARGSAEAPATPP